MALFEQWDDFDFNSAGKDYVEEMIKLGAEYGLGVGISQTRTKQELRDRGFSFGNERFSALWNGLREDSEGFKHFSSLPLDNLPFDDALPQKTYFSSKYRYIGSFNEIDEFGNVGNKISLAIDTNKKLTPREALSILKDVSVSSYGASESEKDSIQIQGALFNPDY